MSFTGVGSGAHGIGVVLQPSVNPPQPGQPTNDSQVIQQCFCIPYEKVAPGVLKTLKAKQRLTVVQKNKLVQSVVDEARKIKENFCFEAASHIACNLYSDFPDSLEDRDAAGARLGNGYYALAKKLKSHVEYANRGNVAARLRQGRQKKSDQVECASGSSDAVCRRDGMSYGCIDWQPSELPQDETEESLLNKKVRLQKLMEQLGPEEATSKERNTLTVPCVLRMHYSDTSSTRVHQFQIKEQWPLLFVDTWLFAHFEQLVGVPAVATMRMAMDSKAERIIEYFRSTGVTGCMRV